MKQLRLLVARVDRIGDVVLSTAIPREIKKANPDIFVAVLVREYTKDIYLNNPYVDAIITYDSNGEVKPFWKMVTELKKYKFNLAFMLLPQERLNYLLFLTRIKTRIGVGHKLYQFLTFTKYIDRKKYIPLRHEADYCLDMVRKIGIDSNNYNPEIHLTEIEKKKSLIVKTGLKNNKQKLIGINVSSGNSAPNLKVSEYLKLLLILRSNPDYQVAVMDNEIPEDIDNVDGIIYPNRKNSLRDSIINFAALDVLISNSTGPMHLAAALDVPTLSLFCPLTACSPKLWGPLRNKSKIILPTEEYCANHCPIDPKKCDYSKEGGLTFDFISAQLENFVKKV
jgi:heptosyltransferase-2